MRMPLRAALLFAATTAMSCPQGQDLMTAYHFTSLKPPSTLYFVGAVVAVEFDKNGDIETGNLRLTCGPRGNLGQRFLPLASHTVTESMRSSGNAKWSLSADVVNSLKSEASLEQLKSVQVEVTNARIYTISDDDLLENLKYRSPDCQRAIDARLKAGHSLTIISSAIMADLRYTVKFEDTIKVDKKVRARQLNDLAISLGGGQTRIGQRTIESKGLALGIKTDSFLMALSLPDPDDDEEGRFDRAVNNHRSVPFREAGTSPESDSELVLPGGYVQPLADLNEN